MATKSTKTAVEEKEQPTPESNAADAVTEGLVDQLQEQLDTMADEVVKDLQKPEVKPKEPPATSPAQREQPAVVQAPFGVWDETTSRKTGRNVLVYGGSGTGKTWFAATWPKPLFLDLEGGMHSISHLKPLRFPKDPSRKAINVEQVKQFYELAKKSLAGPDCPFQTIVIDSLNELQHVIVSHVVEDYDANRQYDDQPTQADYGKILRDFLKVIRSFLALPCHVVFLAVDAPKQYQEEQSFPNFIGRKTAPEIMRLVDAIGYTYTTRGTSQEDIRYMISFANTPDHVAKDRLSIGTASKPNNFQSVFRR